MMKSPVAVYPIITSYCLTSPLAASVTGTESARRDFVLLPEEVFLVLLT